QMVRVEFGSIQTLLLCCRQRTWLVVQFSCIDSLQSNGHLSIFFRRLLGPTLYQSMIEHMGAVKRRRAIFPELDCIGCRRYYDFRRIRIRSARRPELIEGYCSAHLKQSGDHVGFSFSLYDWTLILVAYAVYYNQTRTHLALNKDCPLERPIQRFGSSPQLPFW